MIGSELLPIGAGIYVAAGCLAIAAAIIGTVATRVYRETRREEAAAARPARDAALMRAIAVYSIDARVPAVLIRPVEAGLESMGYPPLAVFLGEHTIDWAPPQASDGEEAEIQFTALATCGELAERVAERRLERLGLEPLAVRARAYSPVA